MEWGTLAILSLATFAGALVQAATGFGFAIIAAPVFLSATNATSVIPILVALHLVQSVMLVPQIRRKAPVWHLKRLLLGSVFGGPIGLWLLQGAGVRSLKLAIGVTILIVIALLLLRARTTAASGRAAMPRPRPLSTVLTGSLSGALTALLAMPGPPLMVLFLAERQAPDVLRALALTYFAALYAGLTLAYIALGYLPFASLATIAWLTPAVIAGTIAGARLAALFSAEGMRLALLALLLLSGLGAIAGGLT